MPQVIPILIGFAFAGAEAFPWIMAGAMMASSLITSMLAKKDPANLDNATAMKDSGNRVNARSTQEPLKVVYGKQRVGGNDVFIETSGSDNNYLWVVQTLAEGECSAIATDADGNDEVRVGDQLESYYGSYVSYWFHTGSESQAVDANLAAAIPEWTDCLRHTCYMVWKLTWDRNYFQGFPARLVDLEGTKVYDFRTGPIPVQWNIRAVWDSDNQWGTVPVYSTNPVLCLYDWMTNTRYGMGLEDHRFDRTTWGTAATYCDTKLFALNMAIRADKGRMDVARDIMSHFRGQLAWYDGKFYLRYSDLNVEASCMTITDEHIVQDSDGKAAIRISEPSTWSKPDALRVKFIDPDKSYIEDDVVVGDDIGVVKQMELLGCTSREMASNLAFYYLERAKLDRTVSGTFRGDCLQLEPHDVVTLTTTALSISSQLMRVEQANITGENQIELVLKYESAALYDDDYDVDVEGAYQCSLPDPRAEPPPVSNPAVTEETYDYRLRTFTRLKVTFDEPAGYNWFDHVEVWLSYDDVTYEHLFNAADDFEIANVAESARYYLRLKTVNIFGGKQQDSNDLKIDKQIIGYTDVPESLAALYAIVNQNTINLYATKVDDPDIELYEFRIGDSWDDGIFLAALRSPNLSLFGVKPGTFTFQANTLSNNGYYGDTPVSHSAVLIDPPDGWTVQDSFSVDSLVTNGTMEADANWLGYGAPQWEVDTDWKSGVEWGYHLPATMGRSSTVAYQGTYSWRFVSAGVNQGIQSDPIALTSGEEYGWSAYVYPNTGVKWDSAEAWAAGTVWGNYLRDSRTARWHPRAQWSWLVRASDILWGGGSMRWASGTQWDGATTVSLLDWAPAYDRLKFKVRKGDDSGYDEDVKFTWLKPATWNLVYGSFTATATGDKGYIAVVDEDGDTGEWFVDNVAVMAGEFDNTHPVLYSGSAYIEGLHSGSLVGTYTSPIFDMTASDRYMVYVLANTAVSGTGTTWEDIFADGELWPAGSDSWLDLFRLESAPSLGIKLYYGETSPPTSVVEKLEILSCIVTGRYFQIEATITDPNSQMHGMLENYEVKFCQ